MRTLLATACAAIAAAHVCLLHPLQRGGANVTDAGDNSCFEPNACTQPSGPPSAVLVAGEGHHVLFQQNLNHYNPGYPGYLDVSIATLAGSQVGNWTVLARVPDYWAHLQAKQTNFTVPVQLPATPCDACVLRVRYAPHKPTEVVFHACADIRTVAGGAVPPPAGNLLALASPGEPVSSSSLSVAVAQLEPSGDVRIITMPPPGVQLLAGASAALHGELFTLARNESAEAADGGPSPANLLVCVHVNDGTLAVLPVTLPPNDPAPPLQWVALAASPAAGVLVLLGLVTGSQAGSFAYQARTLDSATGAASPVLSASADQNTFVNVFQATNARPSGASGSELFLLAGDENSLYALNAAVFTVPLPAAGGGVMTSAVLDNSAWTLGSLHLSTGGRLLAVSPGLYAVGNASAAHWALVEVTPTTGAVTHVGDIAGGAAGIYAPSYAGAVYGDEPAGGASLMHVFQHAVDGSFAIATIDADTGALARAPTLMNGVNNELLFDTPVFVAGG